MCTTCQHDPRGDRTLTQSIVDAIAAETGGDPTTIRPLYDTVDPDALARTYESARRSGPESRFSATFRHAGCEVTVRVDGEIQVRPLEGQRG